VGSGASSAVPSFARSVTNQSGSSSSRMAGVGRPELESRPWIQSIPQTIAKKVESKHCNG
jgi:hypothetical protein